MTVAAGVGIFSAAADVRNGSFPDQDAPSAPRKLVAQAVTEPILAGPAIERPGTEGALDSRLQAVWLHYYMPGPAVLRGADGQPPVVLAKIPIRMKPDRSKPENARDIDEWIQKQMASIPDYAKSGDYRVSWIASNVIAKALQRNGPFGELTEQGRHYVVEATRAVAGDTVQFNEVGRQLLFQALNEYKFSANDRQREAYGDSLVMAADDSIDTAHAWNLIMGDLRKYQANAGILISAAFYRH
jgi:hypothetical protein